MIFNYRVKRNGVYYEAGQDVPMDDSNKELLESEQVIDNLSLDNETVTPKRGRPKKTE